MTRERRVLITYGDTPPQVRHSRRAHAPRNKTKRYASDAMMACSFLASAAASSLPAHRTPGQATPAALRCPLLRRLRVASVELEHERRCRIRLASLPPQHTASLRTETRAGDVSGGVVRLDEAAARGFTGLEASKASSSSAPAQRPLHPPPHHTTHAIVVQRRRTVTTTLRKVGLLLIFAREQGSSSSSSSSSSPPPPPSNVKSSVNNVMSAVNNRLVSAPRARTPAPRKSDKNCHESI
jgi:hypothetical protein